MTLAATQAREMHARYRGSSQICMAGRSPCTAQSKALRHCSRRAVVRRRGIPAAGGCVASLSTRRCARSWMQFAPMDSCARGAGADDIASACRDAATIERLDPTLGDIDAATGLGAHPSKTQIVLGVAHADLPAMPVALRGRFAAFAPRSVRVAVVSEARVLGFMGMHLRLATSFYEHCALSVMCFVAQLESPPEQIRHSEDRSSPPCSGPPSVPSLGRHSLSWGASEARRFAWQTSCFVQSAFDSNVRRARSGRQLASRRGHRCSASLAAVGARSMRTPPWSDEPLVWRMHKATMGSGSSLVEVAAVAAAT